MPPKEEFPTERLILEAIDYEARGMAREAIAMVRASDRLSDERHMTTRAYIESTNKLITQFKDDVNNKIVRFGISLLSGMAFIIGFLIIRTFVMKG